jgi:predicted RNA-binding Zn-ribbon protein involved in translation (DUF1610 family)
MLVAMVETSQLSCPRCGTGIAHVEDACREVGSWIFLDCPSCHQQSDVTFAPIWRPLASF